jgi:hypothetical protein
MNAISLGELQSALIGATRCLAYSDPRCVNLCSLHVDVRADAATASTMRSIEASFEAIA